MSCLIIPDIHLDIKRAEFFISSIKSDTIVFLGDYFDNFYDNVEQSRKTALWLKWSLTKENRTHLIGNHDLAYFSVNKYTTCSGHTDLKDIAINDVLCYADWHKLKWFHWEDFWLLTHAGLNKYFCKHNDQKDVFDFLNKELLVAQKKASELNGLHWFFKVGSARGGNEVVGGLLWNDFDDEFVPIDGIKQICGHTPRNKPEWKDKNLCLDTRLNHVALIENDEIKIISYSDLKKTVEINYKI